MLTSLIACAIAGFGLSLYTYLIEKKVKQNPTYKPVCDISDKISCSKPMKSDYTNVFYVPNSVAGMLFYSLVCLLSLFNAVMPLLVVIATGCVGSALLAYLLYFRIKAFCLVCTSLYVINGVMLYFVLQMIS